MQIFTRSSNDKDLPLATAVAIGNFDGVHLGHQKILQNLVKTAKNQNLVSMVLTFAPHPGKVTGKGSIKLLQTLEQKLEKISTTGVTATYIQDFNIQLAGLTGEEFITSILLDTLTAKIIIVGENFRFGKHRSDDISTLRSIADKYKLQILSTPSVIKNSDIISSSLIRRLLLNGEIQKANTFLGTEFTIKGRVIKGSSRGAGMGFPTANIKTDNEILPTGTFIAHSTIAGKAYNSVCNIGTNPTFSQKNINIESHILNFGQDLYEQEISLSFLQKIRDEIRFDSATELKAQIKQDIKYAENYFRLYSA